MKKSGEPVFTKHYGEYKLDEVVTCGFLSATLSFTNSTFGANINDIEIGPYRIIFDTDKSIQFVVIALMDSSDSIISIRKKLIEIKNEIIERVGEDLSEILSNKDARIVGIFEDVLLKTPKINPSDQLLEDFKKTLTQFRENQEILDSELLSTTGMPLFGTDNRAFVDIAISQMDCFWKHKSIILDQIIMSYENQFIILHKVNESLILVSLIRKNTPIGMATMLIEDAAIKLKSISNLAIVESTP